MWDVRPLVELLATLAMHAAIEDRRIDSSELSIKDRSTCAQPSTPASRLTARTNQHRSPRAAVPQSCRCARGRGRHGRRRPCDKRIHSSRPTARRQGIARGRTGRTCRDRARRIAFALVTGCRRAGPCRQAYRAPICSHRRGVRCLRFHGSWAQGHARRTRARERAVHR